MITKPQSAIGDQPNLFLVNFVEISIIRPLKFSTHGNICVIYSWDDAILLLDERLRTSTPNFENLPTWFQNGQHSISPRGWLNNMLTGVLQGLCSDIKINKI